MLAGIIVLIPVHWAAMFIHYFGDSGSAIITTDDGKSLLSAMPLESLERFLDALLVPGTVIAAGARIAPRFHLAAAVLLTLLLIGSLSLLFAHVSSTGFHIADSTFRIVVNIILWLASVTFGLFYARELDKQDQPA